MVAVAIIATPTLVNGPRVIPPAGVLAIADRASKSTHVFNCFSVNTFVFLVLPLCLHL